jgi:hypothetical protein
MTTKSNPNDQSNNPYYFNDDKQLLQEGFHQKQKHYPSHIIAQYACIYDGFPLLHEMSRTVRISRWTLKEDFLKPLLFNHFGRIDINKSFDLSTI